jgi:hypothetical protein
VLAYYTRRGTLANLFMIATSAIWLVLVPNTAQRVTPTLPHALLPRLAARRMALEPAKSAQVKTGRKERGHEA